MYHGVHRDRGEKPKKQTKARSKAKAFTTGNTGDTGKSRSIGFPPFEKEGDWPCQKQEHFTMKDMKDLKKKHGSS